MKVYQVIEIRGLGVMGYHPTNLIYLNEQDAKDKSDELWYSNTTKSDRESGWCTLNYTVYEIEVLEKYEKGK
jgi:hypothetical protein